MNRVNAAHHILNSGGTLLRTSLRSRLLYCDAHGMNLKEVIGEIDNLVDLIPVVRYCCGHEETKAFLLARLRHIYESQLTDAEKLERAKTLLLVSIGN